MIAPMFLVDESVDCNMEIHWPDEYDEEEETACKGSKTLQGLVRDLNIHQYVVCLLLLVPNLLLHEDIFSIIGPPECVEMSHFLRSTLLLKST